jgi:cyanate permease
MSRKNPQEAEDLAPPQAVDWNALRQTAAFLHKANLADFMAIVNDPWKSAWLNFLAGLARGIGFVVGFTIIGGLMLFGLKKAFAHSAGVPFIGDEIHQTIGYILAAVREAQGKSGH